MLRVVSIVIVALIGLEIGSFLNVVILRLHAGKDFVKGRSKCPHCQHVLTPLELIPIFSWLIQRGRCRNCGKPISIQYPLVELLTAVVFVAAFLAHPFYTYGQLLVLVLWLYVLSSLIALAVYDLRWYLLPDKLLLPVLIPAGAILVNNMLLQHSANVLGGPIIAAILFGGGFYLLAAVSKGRWMGGGDIKLAFVMGLLLGIQRTALAMFLAFILAALVGIGLIVARRRRRQDQIPFGPFLILGTIIAYLFGTQLISWYII